MPLRFFGKKEQHSHKRNVSARSGGCSEAVDGKYVVRKVTCIFSRTVHRQIGVILSEIVSQVTSICFEQSNS